MSRVFAIVPGSPQGQRLLWGMGGLMGLVAALIVWPLGLAGQGPTAAVLLGGAGLLFRVAWSTQNAQVVVSADALRLKGDLFGRTIPRASLRAEEARLISLESDGDHRPTLRTSGTAAPGYLSGWFRLHNREKALLFVTDRRRVVYVPTTRGYALLLSVAAPDEFLQALRS